jgi:uncharacterized protein (TIGR03118 family)
MRRRLHRSLGRGYPSRIGIEPLEDRLLLSSNPVSANLLNPSAGFVAAVLVSDGAVAAPNVDPNLLNAWGIAAGPSGPFWVSDNHLGASTLYDGTGVSPGMVVRIPSRGGQSEPTGVAFNGTYDFLLAPGEPALFLFATENGTVAAWNPYLAGGDAVTVVDRSAAGAVYKGLAVGMSGRGNVIYVANFHDGRVDVFDSHFHSVRLAGSFKDPTLPAGYAPFNIMSLDGHIFVTYAKQSLPSKYDDEPGPGNGFVDEFDTNGRLVRRIARGDPGKAANPLDSPWGLAIAPAGFGPYGGDLLVGNFGSGRIDVYDPNATNRFLGQLTSANGTPLFIDGLWGLTVGNNYGAGRSDTVYYTAGPNGGNDGVMGQIQFAAAGVVTNPASGSHGTGGSATPATQGGWPGSIYKPDAGGHTSTPNTPPASSGGNNYHDSGVDSTVDYSSGSYASNTPSTSSNESDARSAAIRLVTALTVLLHGDFTTRVSANTAVQGSGSPTTPPNEPVSSGEASRPEDNRLVLAAGPLVEADETYPSSGADLLVENEDSAHDPAKQLGMLLPPQLASTISGPLPLDLRLLERGVRRFLQHVGQMDEDRGSAIPGIGLAPWFMTVGVATMIFELARRRLKKQFSNGAELLLGSRVPMSTWVPGPDEPWKGEV